MRGPTYTSGPLAQKTREDGEVDPGSCGAAPPGLAGEGPHALGQVLTATSDSQLGSQSCNCLLFYRNLNGFLFVLWQLRHFMLYLNHQRGVDRVKAMKLLSQACLIHLSWPSAPRLMATRGLAQAWE